MLKKLLPLMFLLAGFQANASLITSSDVYDDGSLEWLHFNFTVNMSSSTALTSFAPDGFRFATADQATKMMEEWFDEPLPLWQFGRSDLESKINEFLEEFGYTAPADKMTLFVVNNDQCQPYCALYGANESADELSIFNGAKWIPIEQYGPPSERFAYAMVRDTVVPEPSVIALFALGLAGIGFARRRQS
jgi:hypothetical protein